MKYHICHLWDAQNPEKKLKEFCDTVEKGLGPRPLGPIGPIGPMVQGPWGPMGPRGLGPCALWAPGALGPTTFRACRRTISFFLGLWTSEQIQIRFSKKIDVLL